MGWPRWSPSKRLAAGCLGVAVALFGCITAIGWSGKKARDGQAPDAPLGIVATAGPELATPTDEPVVDIPGTIPGLAAVDVYGNLKPRGFTCEDRAGAAGGWLWTCKDETAQRSFVVDITARAATRIQHVSATALDFGSGNPTDTAREFLLFVATLPYEGARPDDAKAWVATNLDSPEASTTIGGATLTLRAVERSRNLTISAASATP